MRRRRGAGGRRSAPRFSARLFAGLLEQDEIDPFPQPISLPCIELALHRRAVGKIVRQQTGDLHGSAAYKRVLVEVHLRRALQKALDS